MDLSGSPTIIKSKAQLAHEDDVLTEVFARFSQLQLYRNTFASHWEEVAELVMPTSRNTFYYGNYNWQGEKKTDKQVDANGMIALHRFGAILDSLLTPRNMMWHGLSADDDDLRKDRETQIWFENQTRKLFKMRYAPIANFSSQNQAQYQSLGAFGTGSVFVDQAADPNGNPLPALRYKALPLGETYFTQNHQGLIDGFIRWFRLTPRQAIKQFGIENVPEAVKTNAEQQSENPMNFLHCVWPRSDYDPQRMDHKGKPFASYYVSIEGRSILKEGGYNSFPIAASRYDQTPGETYGRGPAMMVLPALKTLNAEKRVFLKQGHRAADPVLLTSDDGLVDFNMRPGALNKGGMTSDGKRLVDILPSGNIQVTLEMMQEEKALIKDAFLTSLFDILMESPQMTATQVVERVNEKGILIAPTVGRQQSEYLGPLIDRELDLMSEMGVLDPLPPLLKEKGGAYSVNYTSPLSRAMRAQEASGAMRTLENVTSIVNITQDPEPLDLFDFDVMIPEIAEIQGVPKSWMASEEKVAAKRQGRADQAARQQQIQAAPAAAAMMKAETDQQVKTGG